MPRKEPLTGVAREVKTAARLMLNPSKIANHLGDFENTLALPRFADYSASSEPLDALTKAGEVVKAIKTELGRMKAPRPDETEIEAKEREWRARVIDGTYALAREWQALRSITERRRRLIGKEPADTEASVRSHVDGIEREIHEELAIRLSHDPRERQGLHILHETETFIWNLDAVSRACTSQEAAYESERLKSLLLDFMQLTDAVKVSHQLVLLLVVELEKRGGLDDTPRQVRSPLSDSLVTTRNAYINMAQMAFMKWPKFAQRDMSLLRAALKHSGAELDPFLEYLESRDRGRELLSTWCEWAVSTDFRALHDAYTMAASLLYRGQSSELLDEIEETGSLNEERLDDGFDYLCEIGAVLAPSSEDEPISLLYRLYSDRQQNNVPDGWEVVPSDDQDAELDSEDKA